MEPYMNLTFKDSEDLVISEEIAAKEGPALEDLVAWLRPLFSYGQFRAGIKPKFDAVTLVRE
jgi:hypothetical protein